MNPFTTLPQGEGLDGVTVEQLNDPVWRLTSGRIYWIRNKDGQPEPFTPNKAQKRLIARIYRDGWRFIIVPKSRQRGISTLVMLIILDSLMFGTSVQTTLIDFNGANAKKKLSEKVLFAYERLPPAIALLTVIVRKNLQTGEFTIGPNPDVFGADMAKNTSTGFFGDQPRGGTNQILAISEWSEIDARFPQRSKDIKTGALPTAELGLKIVETTWYGGKRGEVWPLVKEAMETPLQYRTENTARLEFFSWFGDPDNYMEGPIEALTAATLDYFREVRAAWPDELKGVEFSVGQMFWYQTTLNRLGIDMRSQHPTVLAECFESPVLGAIWAQALHKARQAGRINNHVVHAPDVEVNVFMDLGSPANTAMLFAQHIRGEHNLIGGLQGGWETLHGLVALLKNTGYKFGTFFLPHDAEQTSRTATTFEAEFREELTRQGVTGKIIILPRTQDITVGINHATLLIGRCYFAKDALQKAMEAWEAYRWKPDEQSDEIFKDAVVVDFSNHFSDCLRYLAESDLLGHLPSTGSTVAVRPYFDPTILKLEAQHAAANAPTLFWLTCSNPAGHPVRNVTAIPDATGWLRVWSGPQQGQRYLVSLIGRCLQVWCADNGADSMALQASPPWSRRVDFMVLYTWAAQLSAFYGLAPIVLDVISHPAAVGELRRMGANVLVRQQREGRRPVGQEVPAMHPGWEWTPEFERQALVMLQGRVRSNSIRLLCPSLVQQAEQLQNDEQGLPSLRDGLDGDLVQGAAMAAAAHAHAGVFRVIDQPSAGGGHGVPWAGGQKQGRLNNR